MQRINVITIVLLASSSFCRAMDEKAEKQRIASLQDSNRYKNISAIYCMYHQNEQTGGEEIFTFYSIDYLIQQKVFNRRFDFPSIGKQEAQNNKPPHFSSDKES